jgi:hypothetical protein
LSAPVLNFSGDEGKIFTFKPAQKSAGSAINFGWVPNKKFVYGSTTKMPRFKNVQMENVDAYAATVLKFGDVSVIDDLIDGIDNDDDYNIIQEAQV